MTKANPRTDPPNSNYGRAYWEFHFEQLERSGLNRKAYCRKHNIRYGRFGYWYERLSDKPKKSKATQLIPIQVTQQPIDQSPSISSLLCRYDTKQGHQLHIYDINVLNLLLERIS